MEACPLVTIKERVEIETKGPGRTVVSTRTCGASTDSEGAWEKGWCSSLERIDTDLKGVVRQRIHTGSDGVSHTVVESTLMD